MLSVPVKAQQYADLEEKEYTEEELRKPSQEEIDECKYIIN